MSSLYGKKQKRPLIEEIRRFRKSKAKTAVVLLLLGVIGLALPIIPGLLFILLALWLVFPDQSEKMWARLKEALAKDKRSS